VILQAATERAAGYYTDPVLGVPAHSDKVYSLSMLLLSAIFRQQPGTVVNAILLMQAERNIEKRALVIILGGQVTLDALLDTDRAIERVNEEVRSVPGIAVFCQAAEIASQHNIISWQDIERLTDKEGSMARLQPMPMSPYLLPAVACAALAIAGVVAYDQQVRQPEIKRRALTAASMADKTPAYVLAVNQQLANAAWDTNDLAQFLDTLRAYPLFAKGWSLESIACDGVACLSRWSRRGGTAADLQAQLPDEQMVINADPNSPLLKGATSTLERMFTTKAHAAKFLPLERQQLQSKEQSLSSLNTPLQMLGNAGIAVGIGEPQRWAGLDVAGVTASEVLMQTPVDITAPLYRANAVLAMLPPNLLIKSFLLNTSEGAMTVNFKGIVYAHQ
jgi:hypothetical protein